MDSSSLMKEVLGKASECIVEQAKRRKKRNSICDDKEIEWYKNSSELKAKKSALARTTA